VWAAAVRAEPDLELTAEHSSVEQAGRDVPAADVVLLAVTGRVEAAVEAIRLLTRRRPETRILAVGIPAEHPVILACIEAGALGFVTEAETADTALAALRGLPRGETPVAPDIAPVLLGRLWRVRQAFVDAGAAKERLEELTPREHQVLALMARELGNREIADQLVIEVGTVKNHVHNILEKLGMESRYQAGAFLSATCPAPEDSVVVDWRSALPHTTPAEWSRAAASNASDR
jgi:DNA-binding NarL/FixJ family response regulator